MAAGKKGKAAREETAARIEALAAPLAETLGLRIYDVDYAKDGEENALTVYIAKDGDIGIDDCEAMSHALSEVLDREDPIPEAYTLYVSSPGLTRTLTKDRHFAASIGEKVELRLFAAPEGSKQKDFEGILKSFDEDTVTVTVDPAAARAKKGQRVSAKKAAERVDLSFARKNIAVIRVSPDF